MGSAFWIRRFLTVLAAAFLIIGAAQLLKGQPLNVAASHAGLWSVLTACVFTAVNYYKIRRNASCAICVDTPESNDPKH